MCIYKILISILGSIYSLGAMEPQIEMPYSFLEAMPPELRAKTIVYTIITELRPLVGRRQLTRAYKVLPAEEELPFEITAQDIPFIIRKLKPLFAHKNFATAQTVGVVMKALAEYYPKKSLKSLALEIKEGFPASEYPLVNAAFNEWLKEQSTKEE